MSEPQEIDGIDDYPEAVRVRAAATEAELVTAPAYDSGPIPYRLAQRQAEATARRGYRLSETVSGRLIASDGTVYVMAPDGARHRLGVKLPRKERKRLRREIREGNR